MRQISSFPVPLGDLRGRFAGHGKRKGRSRGKGKAGTEHRRPFHPEKNMAPMNVVLVDVSK